VTSFHALAAVFALVVLARNAVPALRRARARQASALVPLLACLAATAVLAAAVRGLLLTGATP
jgi:hypothetical protein